MSQLFDTPRASPSSFPQPHPPKEGQWNALVAPRVSSSPSEILAFEALKESPLASFLKERDPRYQVLCDAYSELDRDPKHLTVFMRRLRMMVIERLSCEAIANAQHPPVKPETLWAQISKTSRALLKDVGLTGTAEDFKTETARLKRGGFELSFQPWLAWYSQWTQDPLGVELPPPVFGLVSSEVFDRLALGVSQQGKGVSGSVRPTRAPEPVRREFSVHPFIREGFFGVEVRAMPEAFVDCLDVMPKPRALVLGYHEFLCKNDPEHAIGLRNPALNPEPVAPRCDVRRLRVLEGRTDETGDRLVGSTGALESLRRGIGPFDLNALMVPREICRTGHAAYIDLFPFARGERHTANSLRFPKGQLEQLGITHASIRFEEGDIASLREANRLSFSMYGYSFTSDDNARSSTKVMLGRAEVDEVAQKLHVRFTPAEALVDARSRWYRGEVLNPRLEKILEEGVGEVPSIGWRAINRDPTGRYPSFHLLGQDFCLSRSFTGDTVYVEGQVLQSGDPSGSTFCLSAYADETATEPIGRWSTEVGHDRTSRIWRRGEEPLDKGLINRLISRPKAGNRFILRSIGTIRTLRP